MTHSDDRTFSALQTDSPVPEDASVGRSGSTFPGRTGDRTEVGVDDRPPSGPETGFFEDVRRDLGDRMCGRVTRTVVGSIE